MDYDDFLRPLSPYTRRGIACTAIVRADPDVELVPVVLHGFDENIANYYKTDSSLLVPKQWYLKEDVKAPGRTWPEGSDYNPSLEVQLYLARAEWLARELAEAMVSEMSQKYGREPLHPQTPSSFDALWRSQEGYYHVLIAWQGRQVIQLKYHGLAEADQLLDTIKSKLDEI